MRSRLIVHPMKSSSTPIDQVTFFLDPFNCIHQLCFTYSCKHVIYIYDDNNSTEFIYSMNQKRTSILFFNTDLRFIVLMYYLNQQVYACRRQQIHFITINISLYLYCYSNNFAITSGLQMSYIRIVYKTLFERLKSGSSTC